MPVVAQAGDDAATAVARTYREFGRLEARGRSAAYEALAESVAGDSALVSFIASLPPEKRQPNLLFAAARYLLGAPPGHRAAARAGQPVPGRTDPGDHGPAHPDQRAGPVRRPAACPGPAAAAAGADRGRRQRRAQPAPRPLLLRLLRATAWRAWTRTLLLLRCEPRGPVPLPARIPAISWRAGLDLNPLDVTRADDARWLSCLVWPGEGDRAQRLEAAIASARRDPPAVHRGDMLTGLPSLVAQAPADATLVIYHTSALWYLPAGAAGAVRQHRPRPRRHLAVQRAARRRARYGRTRPGRAHLRPGPRRRRHRPDRKPRDVAAMAALTGEPRR